MLVFYISRNRNDLESIRTLLENGANPNIKKAERWTALHYAANEGHLTIIPDLLNNGAEINCQVSLLPFECNSLQCKFAAKFALFECVGFNVIVAIKNTKKNT